MKIREIRWTRGEVIDPRLRRYGEWRRVVFGGRKLGWAFKYDDDAVLRLLAAELWKEKMARETRLAPLFGVLFVGFPFWLLLLGWLVSLLD